MANKYSTIVHSPAALPAISRNEFDSKSNVQIKMYNKVNKAGTFRKRELYQARTIEVEEM